MPAEVLHSAVVDTIAQDIVDGRLPAGEVLRLDEIQATFDISRTVAREVMRSLEGAGLVEARRRVGLVVQPREEWGLLDPRVIGWRLQGSQREEQLASLTQLRTAVEPMAAGAAARSASAAQCERLVQLAGELARLGAEGDLEAFLEADIAYHSLLLEASGNEMFSALHDVFAVTLSGRTHGGLMPRFPRAEAIEAHMSVARWVHRRDAERAYDEMAAMMSELRGDLFGA
ncbi:MAG: FadR/GntR family transcriptional regulator [Microbacterium sp.]